MITVLTKKVSISVTVLSFVLLTSIPSYAGTRYTSKDGNLVVQYGKQCSTTKPTGSYRVRNGVSGELTALTCQGIGGDIAEHKFKDTSGNERCYGRMTQIWSRKTVTIWKIEGAVSGYPCSQSGKTFEVEMGDAKQI